MRAWSLGSSTYSRFAESSFRLLAREGEEILVALVFRHTCSHTHCCLPARHVGNRVVSRLFPRVDRRVLDRTVRRRETPREYTEMRNSFRLVCEIAI